jgi:hypothetical protein
MQGIPFANVAMQYNESYPLVEWLRLYCGESPTVSMCSRVSIFVFSIFRDSPFQCHCFDLSWLMPTNRDETTGLESRPSPLSRPYAYYSRLCHPMLIVLLYGMVRSTIYIYIFFAPRTVYIVLKIYLCFLVVYRNYTRYSAWHNLYLSLFFQILQVSIKPIISGVCLRTNLKFKLKM